ncbi:MULTISPECIES: hypothetical protein [unclassified Rathayibacter]|uniref:hypothetical protein n=1 Tax=unclassified Rathayibacter TaxID=2609250 RepID=UPI001FB41366|nr:MULTISPECIES: hypothetical protein [unclassified Rathayibacter]MCJ1683124.1 hypothetical protein [Rathayibacter sp. VKM Ac-2928]MCJ1688001.1 hypothetical protein [Rathayibacter sp. VKM Ac-2927]
MTGSPPDPHAPDPHAPDTHAPDDRDPAQQALEAIQRISSGGDPAAAAFALSNAWTDRQVDRLKAFWRRSRRDIGGS